MLHDGTGFRGYVLPEKVWELFDKNESRLNGKIVEIAENTDTGYSLCVTIERGTRLVQVYRNGELEKEDVVVNRSDCTDVVCFMIDTFMIPLGDYAPSVEEEKSEDGENDLPIDDEEDDGEEKPEDEVYEREDELSLAVWDFIETAITDRHGAVNQDYWLDTLSEEDIQDILDEFLTVLSGKYGLPVYRPTLIEDDETREMHYTQYPYGNSR